MAEHDPAQATRPVRDLRLSDLLLWGLRRRKRYRVVGSSMLPTLRPDQQVLVDVGAYRRRRPTPGEIVVARHPFRSDMKLIKRVEAVEPDGGLRLVGDNPAASTDSRSLGIVAPQFLEGRVQCRLP